MAKTHNIFSAAFITAVLNKFKTSTNFFIVLIRYNLSSLSSALVDYLFFFTAYNFSKHILLCTYIARLFSLVYNYTVVRKLVFKSRTKISKSLPTYLLLVLLSGFVSAMIITGLNIRLSVPILISKIIAETIVFF